MHGSTTSRIAIVGALIISAHGLTPAQAVVIDNFEEGLAFSIVDNGAADSIPGFIEQTGLSPANTVGGVRGARVWLGSGNAVSASFGPAVAGDAVEFIVPQGSVASLMELDYGVLTSSSPLRLDLTEGGAHDRLLIEIPQVAGSVSASLFIEGMNGSIGSPEIVVTSPTTLSFLYSDFTPNPNTGPVMLPADLTDIVGLILIMRATGPATIQVSDIRTAPAPAGVPEPITATLGVIGLTVLAHTVKRRRAA